MVAHGGCSFSSWVVLVRIVSYGAACRGRLTVVAAVAAVAAAAGRDGEPACGRIGCSQQGDGGVDGGVDVVIAWVEQGAAHDQPSDIGQLEGGRPGGPGGLGVGRDLAAQMRLGREVEAMTRRIEAGPLTQGSLSQVCAELRPSAWAMQMSGWTALLR